MTMSTPAGGQDSGPTTSARGPRGAIYDIGYQRYDGERLGRPYAIRSLFVHGLRTVFAIGRGARARFVPLAVGGLAIAPAIIQAALAALADDVVAPGTYAGYFVNLSMVFALFCAAQAPELVSADLRTRTLVLYLSRALRRMDYVLARILALAAGMFLLTVAPLLILFAGNVFAAAEPWAAFASEAAALAPIVGSSVVIGILMAAVSIAIASFTPRRALATAAVLGFFLVAAVLSDSLRSAIAADWDAWLVMLNPFLALGGFAHWVFDARPQSGTLAAVDLPGWSYAVACTAYIGAALGVLLTRYRRVDA